MNDPVEEIIKVVDSVNGILLPGGFIDLFDEKTFEHTEFTQKMC